MYTRKPLGVGNVKERLPHQELQMGKEDIKLKTLNHLGCTNPKENQRSFTVESHQESKVKTSKDKQSLCKASSQIMKLSQTSAAALTLNDQDYSPFWNDSVKEISMNLPLHIKTDCAGSDSKYLRNSQRYLDAKSSSSTTSMLHQKKSSLRISSQLRHLSVQECMDYANTDVKCERTYLKLKKETKKIYMSWMKLSNEIYNYCVDYLLESKKISKYNLRSIAKDEFADKISNTSMPNSSLEYSVFEAITASKMGKNLEKRTSKDFSIAVDGRCVKNGFIYKTNTKKQLRSLMQNKRSITKIMDENTIASLIGFDCKQVCRIIFKRNTGHFFITNPVPLIKEGSTPKRSIISLDPGIRTFITYYDRRSCGEIGKSTSVKIKRLNKSQDNIQAKLNNEKKYGKRKNLFNAKQKIQAKINNVVDDLHKKACNFLGKYKYVILPEFKTKGLLKKLNKYSSRALQNLSHFKFKLRLIQKANETGAKIIICNEAYTSKTCTNCGNLKMDLGKAKLYKCDICDLEINRDINGARNILLRVLRGGSS